VGVAQATESAVPGVAALTRRAVAAVPEGGENDVVTDGAIGDSRADLGHDAGGLVAGYQRGGHVVLAVDAAQVTAAHAGRHDLDTHLSGSEGCGVLEVVGETDVLFPVALLD
jgi:hypothetical protein